MGKKQAGLYHLLNIPLDQIHEQLSAMVISALKNCSLYSFFANSMPNKSAFSVFNNSYNLWHHRLGHVSDSTLKHISCIPHVSKSNKDTCLSCPMAKFTKLPFFDSGSHCQIAFQMIHIDIWGPYKVPTLGQNRYFLIIVDDFSRGVWIYLLVQKSYAYSVLKSFITFVLKQFEKEVKVIRSNNASEFLKGSLGPFMKKIGIEHQTSCVDRPQQNGRVERKHKNILEIARALRFHAHLPLSYWGDYVIIATYLINRFPSTVLGQKTPYELLMNKKPTYSNLKVFGCLDVASNPARVNDKMAPRGVPCLFLGCPPHQKGYTLLNLLTHTRVRYTAVETSAPTTSFQPTVPVVETKRSARQHVTPTWLKDFVTPSHVPRANQVSLSPLQHTFQAFLCALVAQVTPTYFKQAIKDPAWCKAMNDELRALELNGTWELTVTPPKSSRSGK
ncbi:cysteine-rich receptor-like protein kinase 8, partial [Tanacetum coccineum]